MCQPKHIFHNYGILSLALCLVIVSFGFRPGVKPVAQIAKIVQEVEMKLGSDSWKKATPAAILGSGDAVKTGRKSFALVKFIDKSNVRVRENSTLTIAKEGILKSVDLQDGGFGFNITKQQNEKFQFTSPTSVASIRGTKGTLSHGADGDTLVVTEGLVNLKNNSSGNDVNVGADSIGFSNSDGTVSVRPASEGELAAANAEASGGTQHEINIEFKDSTGNKKDLKFKYKK